MCPNVSISLLGVGLLRELSGFLVEARFIQYLHSSDWELCASFREPLPKSAFLLPNLTDLKIKGLFEVKDRKHLQALTAHE